MNRVIGHYCAGEKPCTHCEYGYPFSYPLTWQIVSDKTLCVLHEHALKQIEEAVGALRSIEAERGARDA
jgi:hypothetical protein